jgi:20S proteasome subunit alpha 6
MTPDITVPPFCKVPVPSSLKLFVYLDTARPLSEPKWAKTGDVQDWLKSMFGRMFWVAGDAAEGWEKKIHVVDPDPVRFIYNKLLALYSTSFSSPRQSGQFWMVGLQIPRSAY